MMIGLKQIYGIFFKKIFYLGSFFVIANFLAAIAVPAVIPFIENLAGRALSYEVLLRLYLIFACGLLVYFLTLMIAWRPRAPIWQRGLILAWSAFGALMAVFIFDQRWSLTEEYSWIRYPTALALLGSSWLWCKIAYQNRFKKVASMVAAALGSAFLFAASDELFLIHEKIGDILQKFFHWPDFTTDLVTLFYGLAGLFFVIFTARTLNRFLSSRRKEFLLNLYLWGLIIFGLAAIFDTFDNQIFGVIQKIADSLSARGYGFSDSWFIIWKPKIFLNSWEEIFEFLAAGLFAFGAQGIQSPEHFLEPRIEQNIAPSLKRKQTIMLAVSGLLLLAIFFLISLGLRDNGRSPLSNDVSFGPITKIQTGLFHADDLFFHPNWGVLAANESKFNLAGKENGPGVFLFKNKVWQRVPDPQNQLRDVDSVTANARAIYVSDATQGKIFRYSCLHPQQRINCAWAALPLAKNFPAHPEGLFVDDNDIITVIDESDRSITRIKPNGEIIKEQPAHPLWQAPEGIIWHPGLKKFLITDDTTGAIFKYWPGQALEIFADASRNLRFPEDIAIGRDGAVIVSDNGRREIIIFSAAGVELKRLRFKLLYRDLQGVTVDEDDSIFVISANGFDNSSFIPSIFWGLGKRF